MDYLISCDDSLSIHEEFYFLQYSNKRYLEYTEKYSWKDIELSDYSDIPDTINSQIQSNQQHTIQFLENHYAELTKELTNQQNNFTKELTDKQITNELIEKLTKEFIDKLDALKLQMEISEKKYLDAIKEWEAPKEQGDGNVKVSL